jgi:hypothetical protein
MDIFPVGLPHRNHTNVYTWPCHRKVPGAVILRGYTSRPPLKSDAEHAVKAIEGIESGDNEIKVLPASRMDDRIPSVFAVAFTLSQRSAATSAAR